jgi:hypothetical protein
MSVPTRKKSFTASIFREDFLRGKSFDGKEMGGPSYSRIGKVPGL